MPNYTGSTSEVFQVVQRLNAILEQRPAITTGPSDEVWNSIQAVITQTSTPAFNALNSQLSGVYSNAVQAVTGPINTQIENGANGITGLIDDIINAIETKIQGFVDTVTGYWDTVTEWINGLIDGISDTIDAVGEWIGGIIETAKDWLVDAITDVYTNVKNYIAGVIDRVSIWVGGVYSGVREWIGNAITNARDWIMQAYQNISGWISGVLERTQDLAAQLAQTVEDKIQGILDWIETAKNNLVNWWHGLLNDVGSFISTKLIPAWDSARKGAEGIVGVAKIIWEAVSAGNYQKAFDVIDKFFQGIGIPAPVETLWSIVSMIAYFWESIHLQFVGMEISAQKTAIINLGLEPVSLEQAANAVYRGLISETQFYDNAKLAGIHRDRAKIVLDASRYLPTPGQVQEAFLRGEINLARHDQLLHSYGLSDENINLIKALYLIIPGPSDLIRMAVREAFTPEIAEKFGQYQDYPKDFTTWAVKQGLSEDWAKRYWAAHWDLPSATMGFEMLHRGVISKDELTLLLRALDVMPYWRERLIKISYNPLTRVDVRRMYSLGVLKTDQVKRAYLDLGYDEQKANWLTDFTVRYYTPEDDSEIDQFRTLARTTYSQAYKKHIISENEYRKFLENLRYHPDDIELLVQLDNWVKITTEKLFDIDGYRKDWLKLVINAYDRGLIHHNETRDLLIGLGYEGQEADLELDLSDYNRQLKIRNMITEAIHDQYVTFIIDNVGLYNILDQFNFTHEEIAKLEEEWNIERALRTKRPPLSDLRRFLTQGLISLDQFLDELRGQGYNEKYIDLYAVSLGPTGG